MNMEDWIPDVGRVIRVVSRIYGDDSYDIVGDHFTIKSLVYSRYDTDELTGFKAINEDKIGVYFDMANRENSVGPRMSVSRYTWRPDPQKERSNKLGNILGDENLK